MTDESSNLLQHGLKNIKSLFTSFIRTQATASWFLLGATLLALWWANSEYASTYENMLDASIGFFLGDFKLHTSLKHLVNDGLMVIFFFLLGLEIKREVLAGHLAQADKRHMLIICAVGGMLCPAVIYLAINWSYGSTIGWGIPVATDTAFALGVLTIVRQHIPSSLLAFLVGLAILDDIGAILVIAIFYVQDVSLWYLLGAFILIAFLALGSYAGVRQRYFYILVGIAAWWLMLKSGVHPTITGVAVAFTVPARTQLNTENLQAKAQSIMSTMQQKSQPIDVLGSRNDHDNMVEVRNIGDRASTPLRRWEDALELPVSLIILPLFVLFNAGIPFSLASIVDSMQHPIGLGIMAGLVIGKCIGISAACWLGLGFKIGRLPAGVHFQHIVGVSLVAGIGFTMSTFIATLGFAGDPEQLHNAKSSIMVASLVSAILGVLYLRCVASRKKLAKE